MSIGTCAPVLTLVKASQRGPQPRFGLVEPAHAAKQGAQAGEHLALLMAVAHRFGQRQGALERLDTAGQIASEVGQCAAQVAQNAALGRRGTMGMQGGRSFLQLRGALRHLPQQAIGHAQHMQGPGTQAGPAWRLRQGQCGTGQGLRSSGVLIQHLKTTLHQAKPLRRAEPGFGESARRRNGLNGFWRVRIHGSTGVHTPGFSPQPAGVP